MIPMDIILARCANFVAPNKRDPEKKKICDGIVGQMQSLVADMRQTNNRIADLSGYRDRVNNSFSSDQTFLEATTDL